MSFFHSPRIVTDGLVTYIDAGNPKCYPGTGTTVYNLANPNETGSNNGSRNFPTFTNDNLGNFYFNDNDILDIQNYFANIHYGRPRNDGSITPLKRTVTKEEVDARLGRRDVLYVQNDKGEFIPVWRTVDF